MLLCQAATSFKRRTDVVGNFPDCVVRWNSPRDQWLKWGQVTKLIHPSQDCVPASGVTPSRVMLCVVHYAVRAWAVSITPVWSGRGVRAVGSDGVSMAMEVSER